MFSTLKIKVWRSGWWVGQILIYILVFTILQSKFRLSLLLTCVLIITLTVHSQCFIHCHYIHCHFLYSQTKDFKNAWSSFISYFCNVFLKTTGEKRNDNSDIFSRTDLAVMYWGKILWLSGLTAKPKLTRPCCGYALLSLAVCGCAKHLDSFSWCNEYSICPTVEWVECTFENVLACDHLLTYPACSPAPFACCPVHAGINFWPLSTHTHKESLEGLQNLEFITQTQC